MRICLDTSAYSAFFRGDPAVRDLIQRADEIVLPPVVLGELLGGFRSGSRWAENRRLLDDFLSSRRVRVAAIDAETAERYSEILAHLRRQGRPIPTNDLWIAASAMQHGLRLVTTDAHFAHVPQVSRAPIPGFSNDFPAEEER